MSYFYLIPNSSSVVTVSAVYPMPWLDAEVPVIEIPEQNLSIMGYRYLGALTVGVSVLGADYLDYFEAPPVPQAYWNGTEWIGPGNVACGTLTLEPATVSDSEIPVYSGGDVTINCAYTCTNPNATVTYSWANGGGLPIVGATSSSLTIEGITDVYQGNYTCTVYASNGTDFGSLAQTFSVTVYPVIP